MIEPTNETADLRAQLARTTNPAERFKIAKRLSALSNRTQDQTFCDELKSACQQSLADTLKQLKSTTNPAQRCILARNASKLRSAL